WVSTVTPVERIEALDPSRYTITLADDGAALAQLDCDSGRGSYEIEEVTAYFMRDGGLFMEMPYDTGTMRLTAALNQE
ncbi:MAG: hypothetical protein PVG24_12915, partial [Gammaproteobacteria bacterium]